MIKKQNSFFFFKIKNFIKNTFPRLLTFYIYIKIFLNLHRKNKEMLINNNLAKEKYFINSSDLVIGQKILKKGNFEFEKFIKVIKLLKKKVNFILIDIGANIGTVCIPAIRRGFFQKCIAIEPDPYNFSLLKKNIKINGLNKNIKIINTALGSDDNKRAVFELSEYNFGDHRVRNENDLLDKNYYLEKQRKTIVVKLTKLDTVLKKINPKNVFLWIDVQGYEGFVLEGARNTLKHNPPLVIEFWPYALERSGCTELLKEIIIKANYKNCYDLGCNRSLGIMTKKKFDKIQRKYLFQGEFNNLKHKMLGKPETDLFFYN